LTRARPAQLTLVVLGLLSVYINYEADRQKEVFRASNGR
jgi:hypothetical protein